MNDILNRWACLSAKKKTALLLVIGIFIAYVFMANASEAPVQQNTASQVNGSAKSEAKAPEDTSAQKAGNTEYARSEIAANSALIQAEVAKAKFDRDIRNIANMIKEAIAKNGTLKDEKKLLEHAMQTEQEIGEAIIVFRNDSGSKSKIGILVADALNAEKDSVRGMVDGLQAAANGFDYRPGLEAGSKAYSEYQNIDRKYQDLTGNFKKQMGYVRVDEAEIHSQPSRTSPVIKTLKRDSGLDVSAIWNGPSWYRVESKGEIGWVEETSIILKSDLHKETK